MPSWAHLQCEGAAGGSRTVNMLKGPVSQSPHCQEGNAVTRGSVGVTYRAWGARGWGGQEFPLMEGTASRVPTVRRRQAGARPIQQRPRHSPGLRSREESVEQHDKPGARAQATPPARPGGRLHGVPGVQGDQQRFLRRQVVRSSHVNTPMAAGADGMEEGKQEFRAKRKEARTRVWLRGRTEGAASRACFEGRDTRSC